MKSGLFVVSAVSLLMYAGAVMAQSLTPITGWVPLDSAKGKMLEQTSPVKGEVAKAGTVTPPAQ